MDIGGAFDNKRHATRGSAITNTMDFSDGCATEKAAYGWN